MKNSSSEIKKYSPIVEKVWGTFLIAAFVIGYIFI